MGSDARFDGDDNDEGFVTWHWCFWLTLEYTPSLEHSNIQCDSNRSTRGNCSMRSIRITGEFGLIIRREALRERGVSMELLLSAVDSTAPLDMDDRLISFGPSFGEEALNEFTRRLAELGLVFYDDFFDVIFDSPSWCSFRAELDE